MKNLIKLLLVASIIGVIVIFVINQAQIIKDSEGPENVVTTAQSSSEAPVLTLTNSYDVIAVGTVALRWQAAFLPLHALIVGTNMLMQSTRHIKQATFLSMNRQGVYFIPAILILPRLFGLFGVEISQAVADLLSTVTAIPYMVWFFKKLRSME